uniref:GLI family zinc finger 4 n=1 Tax=Molossus molossus TaxID=27622 RepID=A0A7J8BAN2_MOLMO|nr:GLI family zinc finger 4 [Molossus molossus]
MGEHRPQLPRASAGSEGGEVSLLGNFASGSSLACSRSGRQAQLVRLPQGQRLLLWCRRFTWENQSAFFSGLGGLSWPFSGQSFLVWFRQVAVLITWSNVPGTGITSHPRPHTVPGVHIFVRPWGRWQLWGTVRSPLVSHPLSVSSHRGHLEPTTRRPGFTPTTNTVPSRSWARLCHLPSRRALCVRWPGVAGRWGPS